MLHHLLHTSVVYCWLYLQTTAILSWTETVVSQSSTLSVRQRREDQWTVLCVVHFDGLGTFGLESRYTVVFTSRAYSWSVWSPRLKAHVPIALIVLWTCICTQSLIAFSCWSYLVGLTNNFLWTVSQSFKSLTTIKGFRW